MIRSLLFICCFSIYLTSFSQEKENFSFEREIPVSIFTFDMKAPYTFTYEKPMVETLDLKKFKFLFINQESIRDGVFNVDLRNIGRTASNMSYESYRDRDLYKYIPRVYDLRTIPWREL